VAFFSPYWVSANGGFEKPDTNRHDPTPEIAKRRGL